jgi:glycine/D-amino acid oxidase-like deaminating enzyme/nitrite reductase/ring-hydroxylating ferredoxin subunit
MTLPTPSLWQSTSSRTNYPKLEGHRRADVVVIGGGITGLTTALLAKRNGAKVIVLEAHEIGSGTTAKSSAHLSTLWDEGYPDLLKRNYEGAKAVSLCMTTAIDKIESLTQELSIPCAFQRVPGYLYSDNPSNVNEVEEELTAAEKLGLPVSFEPHVPLPFPTLKGMKIERQGQFQPYAYLQALAKAVNDGDCTVFEHSQVNDISDGTPCKITTDSGGHITADCIVMATHTPLGFNPVQTEVAPYRSYLMAFPSTQTLPDALFWDCANPYHYIREFSENGQRWTVVGGNDRKTAHGNDLDSFGDLRSYAEHKFGQIVPSHSWSAQFYVPADHLPYIGRSPFASRTFIATGFSGDGLTLGTAAGMLIADILAGRDNPVAEIFRPTRVKTSGLKKFVDENIDVAKHFVKDRFVAPHTSTFQTLALEQGSVARSGTKLIAGYKDADGTLHQFSATCPHLKCVVHWNAAEKTFDCPCHGSRFDCKGGIIEGPALTGLEPL